jgi:hypothetical protein
VTAADTVLASLLLPLKLHTDLEPDGAVVVGDAVRGLTTIKPATRQIPVIPAQAGIHAVELGTGFRRCDGI